MKHWGGSDQACCLPDNADKPAIGSRTSWRISLLRAKRRFGDYRETLYISPATNFVQKAIKENERKKESPFLFAHKGCFRFTPSPTPMPRNSACPSCSRLCESCRLVLSLQDLSPRKGKAIYQPLLDWRFVAVIPSHRENRNPNSDLQSDFPSIWGAAKLAHLGFLGVVRASAVPCGRRAQHPVCKSPWTHQSYPGPTWMNSWPLASAREWVGWDGKKRWGRATGSGQATLSLENDLRPIMVGLSGRAAGQSQTLSPPPLAHQYYVAPQDFIFIHTANTLETLLCHTIVIQEVHTSRHLIGTCCMPGSRWS